MLRHYWSYWSLVIFSTHNFKKLYHTLFPHITLISQCLVERAKLQRAAVWNISLGSHGKISIHNWFTKDHRVWNCVLLGYRLKTTYMSYQDNLKGKLGKSLKIYILLLTYNPVHLYIIYLQNMYQIDNLVIVITHNHYMSQYILYENTHPWNDPGSQRVPSLYVNCRHLVQRLVYTRVRGKVNQYFKNIQRYDFIHSVIIQY